MVLCRYVSSYAVVTIMVQSCFKLGSSVDKIRHFLYPFQRFSILSVLDY